MGGNAFVQTLPATTFPRIPTAVYNVLKARLTPRLQSLYVHVAVPFEAPEKSDHGDLDFVVALLKDNGVPEEGKEAAVQEEVKKALGAKFCILLEGNRTSNFAVPIEKGDWDCGDDKFYQVDVHVCTDQDEWERVVFFHGYGDLGMIMGLIVRNKGLALGTKGLKVPDPPYPAFHLSSSPADIMRFLGLSMDTWERGFETRLDVFKWAASCRLFDSSRLRVKGPGIRKVKDDRTMYTEFVSWAVEGRENDMDQGVSAEETAALTEEALVFFNKKDEYDSLVRSRSTRAQLKESFKRSVVNEWTGLGGYWQGVKKVMDGVREKFDGDEGILQILEMEGEEGLKRRVLDVKNELGLSVQVDEHHASALS